MSLRVGLDLVSTQSIDEALAAHGQRYLDRVYSPREIADCRPGAHVDRRRLAARFAAKEATFKVLEAGDEAVPWTDVEVREAPSGAVTLSLSGRAVTLAEGAGITELRLGLAHQRGCAAAVVVAEIPEGADI